MATTRKKKITDLHFDQHNINKGSQLGNALLEKSLREVGAGRSILVDKNGVIIAGNQTVQKAAELGFEDVIEVETTGRQLVVVKRMDLDINSEMGAKAKILDNTVSKHNYVEDAEVAEAVCEEYNLEPEELGMKRPGPPGRISRENLEPYQMTHILISCPPEKLLRIQAILEQVKNIEGVEYEQSSN